MAERTFSDDLRAAATFIALKGGNPDLVARLECGADAGEVEYAPVSSGPDRDVCACVNCSRPSGHETDIWDGRLDAYCTPCAEARCDAYPGSCPPETDSAPVSSGVDEERAVEAAKRAIIAEVGDRLDWNVRAYGLAWTGEDGDTEFIVGDSARKAIEAALPFLRSPADEPSEEEVEAAAAAAFWQDDLGGHVKGRWTWDTIPDEGRENYRQMIRAALRAAAESREA